jgi:hypothetical protein
MRSVYREIPQVTTLSSSQLNTQSPQLDAISERPYTARISAHFPPSFQDN